MEINDVKRQLQKLNNTSMGQLSTLFMELSLGLKDENVSVKTLAQVDHLFKKWLIINQNINTESKNLFTLLEESEKRYHRLQEEKRRYESLFISGIVFSSPTEMAVLMERAISIVIKELLADAGFIILTDDTGAITHTFSQNMEPSKDPSALKMSQSVIQEALSGNGPVNYQKGKNKFDPLESNSILSLGIKSALCVPLMLEDKVLGAVYLDRRKTKSNFMDIDLNFLLSFARQIVQGMDISLEISALEDRLIDEATMDFDDLRQKFKCDAIICRSKKMFDLLKIALKISPTNASVIILGENGTGKELLAHAIHDNSRRAGKPFIAINCSAIPDNLLESELFGYESGAFTGASGQKPGKFELADRGTLFFDEIGEMNINLQAKLLRAIQFQEIERLGSTSPTKVDVRILAATNRNLKEMIGAGAFREDLYYRLKVVQLQLPSLYERPEDIEALANHFLTKHAVDGTPMPLSPEALNILEDYKWPGNIRELENIILRGIVLAHGDTFTVTELPEEIKNSVDISDDVSAETSLAEAEKNFRRKYIMRVLRKTGSKSAAARQLGINRTHLHRILSQLEIE